MYLIQKNLGQIQGRIEPFTRLPSMRKMTSHLRFHANNYLTSAYTFFIIISDTPQEQLVSSLPDVLNR